MRAFKNTTTTENSAPAFLSDSPSLDELVLCTVLVKHLQPRFFGLLVAVKLSFKAIIYLEKQYTRINYSFLY